jgi:hypothetical protein
MHERKYDRLKADTCVCSTRTNIESLHAALPALLAAQQSWPVTRNGCLEGAQPVPPSAKYPLCDTQVAEVCFTPEQYLEEH